ncbi:MAG: ABC transporter permease [Syntrophomonadaceae bacterium]|jgi:putative ABC transport system permease protein|nr:ABC transporter permease [Syntrophomonadaceae bacterium]
MKRRNFYLKMITSSLVRRRSRMLVALLAVAIGATVLSGMVTVYYDIPRQMGQEFRSYGANLILVSSGDNPALSIEETERAKEYFPAGSVVGVAPYRYKTAKINEQPFMIAGTELSEAKKASPYWFVNGGWPESAGEALIGQEVADTIRLLPGGSFTLTGTSTDGGSFTRDFSVSGIIQTGGTEEAFIFMSLEDLDNLIGAGAFDVVECSISATEAELNNIAAQISENVPGVAPRLVKRVTQSEGAVLAKLQSLVYLVTAVVLLLTMICVATTMMAVVAERRREIGLKKALGAANKSIINEFLGEGVFLGGLGGLLGVALGFVFAQFVSVNVFHRSITLQPMLIPATLIMSFIITGLACLAPVRSATDVDPAIVLRGE